MVLLSARGNCRGSNERVRSNAVGVLFGISLVRDGQTIVDTLERLGWVGLGWSWGRIVQVSMTLTRRLIKCVPAWETDVVLFRGGGD